MATPKATTGPSHDQLITAALAIGSQAEDSQTNMLKAFALKEKDTKGVQALAKDLGLSGTEIKQATPQSLQLIAQQKFQQQGAIVQLFTSMLAKMDEIRQRIIQNIGR